MPGPTLFVVIESNGSVKSPVGYFTSRTEAVKAVAKCHGGEIKESPLSMFAEKWFANFKPSQYTPDSD